MRATPLLVVGAVLALTFSIGGCSCGSNNPTQPDGGTHPDGGLLPDGGPVLLPDGGPSGHLPDGGSCQVETGPCSSGSQCCSALCDLGTNKCVQPAFCKGQGDVCGTGADCCTGSCDSTGHCGVNQCKDVGATCGSPGECCTGLCNGTCQYPSGGGACHVTGESCTAGSQCCSTNCQADQCIRADQCQANGDLCHTDLGCCSGLCSVNDGGSGVCQTVSGGGGGGHSQAGLPCTSGTECTSRICRDPGSGATTCAKGEGCHMTGDPCTQDSQCCGSVANGVTCSGNATTPGECGNGTSCNGSGNTCGENVLPDGGGVSSSQNCCDQNNAGGSGGHVFCKLSSEGIPRCFGAPQLPDGGVGQVLPDGGSTSCPTGYTGAAGCCIVGGNPCDFSDECCNGAKCVPDSTGTPVCTTQSCSGLGVDCTGPDGGPGNACCAGSICGRSGEFGWVCQLPPPVFPGTDGGTSADGGVVDAGTPCSGNGATCAVSGDCCSGICQSGTCQVPTTCQPQDAVCTTGADCCSGLNCLSGADGGLSCQTSTCAQGGQTCSPSSGCCSGFTCVDSTFNTCAGTSACSCQVIIH